MNKYAYTLFGFIKMATQTEGGAANYAMPGDIPQISLDDIMGVTQDDMKKHYKSTMADNMQSIRDRFMTAAAGKNIDLGADENETFQNWYNWASNHPEYESKVHQPLIGTNPTGSAAQTASSGDANSAFGQFVDGYAQQAAGEVSAYPHGRDRVGREGFNPALVARQKALEAAGPGTNGVIPTNAQFTRADLSKVDKKMMDKYRHLTGAGNPNSDMDRWKTLMAMTNRPASEYSNKAYKKWSAGQPALNPVSDLNPAAGNNTPFTMDDLRKVDKKMMDKYKNLTGAGNPNSDMDRWKTLMAARHGKNWGMYSNDEFKKWRSGLNKAPMGAPAPAVQAPRRGDGSLLMMGRPQQATQKRNPFQGGFRPQFNILGGGM